MVDSTHSVRWSRAIALAAVVCGLAAGGASACPVCFGDPESPLAQGAASGVMFMAIVTYALLMGMAGMAAFWFVRVRRIRLRAMDSDAGRTL